MANYVMLFKGGNPPTSEEEGTQVMQAWGAWLAGLGQAAVDSGSPFGTSRSIAPGGAITDGSTADLLGYTIVTADTLDAATALAKDCPHLTSFGSATAGTVEIYEVVPVM